MVQIFLFLCSLSDPNVCKNVALPNVSLPSFEACSAAGQMIAADYLSRNPGWRLVAWRCVRGPIPSEDGKA